MSIKKSFIYIISTDEYAKINKYKVGKHFGSESKLLSRYRTYLINPKLFYTKEFSKDNINEIEEKIKATLIDNRIKNNTGRFTEWVLCDLEKIKVIIEHTFLPIPVKKYSKFKLLFIKYKSKFINYFQKHSSLELHPNDHDTEPLIDSINNIQASNDEPLNISEIKNEVKHDNIININLTQIVSIEKKLFTDKHIDDIKNGDDKLIRVAELYSKYKTFCYENKEHPVPLNKFYNIFDSNIVKKKKIKGITYYEFNI